MVVEGLDLAVEEGVEVEVEAVAVVEEAIPISTQTSHRSPLET